MYRNSILLVITLFTLLIFAACGGAAPQASEEAEAAPIEAPAAESAEDTGVESTEETASAEGEAATYTVDTQASTVEWHGSKPVGSSESGTVAVAEGQLSFAGSTLVEGFVMIDMTSIETTTQGGDMKGMLEGHLKSDEFFGVETYPTATLIIKSAEPTDIENQYAVVADLTIKETTDEIEFITDVVVGAGTLEATANIVVDRSIYDVRYGSGSFFSNLGDDLISDEMELTVSLVAGS